MMFTSAQTQHWTLKDAKNLAKRVLDYGKKHHCLNDTQIQQLSYILQPSIHPEQHQIEIARVWRELAQTLRLHDDKGVEYRFELDEVNQMVYFGDEVGLQTAKEIHQNIKSV